jgi:hypothetical protein
MNVDTERMPQHNDVLYIGGKLFLLHTTDENTTEEAVSRVTDMNQMVTLIFLGRAADLQEKAVAFDYSGWSMKGLPNSRIKRVSYRKVINEPQCFILLNTNMLARLAARYKLGHLDDSALEGLSGEQLLVEGRIPTHK